MESYAKLDCASSKFGVEPNAKAKMKITRKFCVESFYSNDEMTA